MSKRALFFLLAATPILAFGNSYETGQKLYTQHGCYGCHGPSGEGNSGYPKLAKKSRTFLETKLQKYKEGLIKSPGASLMAPFAKELSPSAIKAIAEFLSQPKKEEGLKKYDPPYQSWGDGGS